MSLQNGACWQNQVRMYISMRRYKKRHMYCVLCDVRERPNATVSLVQS